MSRLHRFVQLRRRSYPGHAVRAMIPFISLYRKSPETKSLAPTLCGVSLSWIRCPSKRNRTTGRDLPIRSHQKSITLVIGVKGFSLKNISPPFWSLTVTEINPLALPADWGSAGGLLWASVWPAVDFELMGAAVDNWDCISIVLVVFEF